MIWISSLDACELYWILLSIEKGYLLLLSADRVEVRLVGVCYKQGHAGLLVAVRNKVPLAYQAGVSPQDDRVKIK